MLLRRLFISHSINVTKRSLFLMSSHKSYEGDGKTTVTVLNKNFDYGLMIDNVSEHGFILNNGIRTVGPMIVFPKTMLSWNISSSLNMNEESFSLLLHLEPKLDIVVIGLDDEYPFNAPFILNSRDIFRKSKIPLEILQTHHACSTFNFLNSENRYVAGALIPPKLKTPESILLKDNGKKNIERTQSQTIFDSYALDLDPLIVPKNLKNQNTHVPDRKKISETFRVRSPWKSESEELINLSNKKIKVK